MIICLLHTSCKLGSALADGQALSLGAQSSLQAVLTNYLVAPAKAAAPYAGCISTNSSIWLLPCWVPPPRAPWPNRADAEVCALRRAAPHVLRAGAGGTASHAARMLGGWKLQSDENQSIFPPFLPEDPPVSVKTLDGRQTKIHKAHDQRGGWADGLGAVARSNVAHQGTRSEGNSRQHIACLLPG